MSGRSWIFVVIVIGCAVGAAAYVGRAVLERSPDLSPPLPALAGSPLPDGPLLVFARQTGSRDGRDGSLGVAPLSDPGAARFEETVRCDRLHMNGGRGVCLARRGRFAISFVAVMLDNAFQPTGELGLPGMSSRTQVSPSGRYAATTVFVTGHSYEDSDFSTQTSIIDLDTQFWLVENFETLSVRRDGRPFRAVDFNFWGVTFTGDGRTYFATLGTGGRTYLVRGAIGSDVLDVVADDVECPSLSPDNRRIAFKRRVASGFGSAAWRIQVLDLDTGRRHDLAETRHVDDQVQWLDDERVMYAIAGDEPARMDTWVVPADGSGSPQMLIPSSRSAFVLHRAPSHVSRSETDSSPGATPHEP